LETSQFELDSAHCHAMLEWERKFSE
jgi:hypothetical protein